MVRSAALQLVLQERIKSRSSTVQSNNMTGGVQGNQVPEQNFAQNYPAQWILIGTDDECVARTRVEDPNHGIPSSLHGRILSTYGLSYLGDEKWAVSAEYRDRPQADITSFSTGGGSITLTQSIQTLGEPSPPDVNRNLNRAINFDGKRVAGTDVVTPSPSIVIIQRMKRELFEGVWPVVSKQGTTEPDPFTGLTENELEGNQYKNYLQLLTDYTGKVCDGVSGGWPLPAVYKQREALLNNATGRLLNTDIYEITYELGIQLNETIKLPSSLNDEVITVTGWDYLWYEYEREDNPNNSRTLPQPSYFRIEQIYYERTFSNIIPPFGQYDPDRRLDLPCTTVPFQCDT